ncbi:unnamed protein product, partial [Natator depressus]
MTESDILQKLTTAATKKQPGVKPIKGISGFIGGNMEIAVAANMTAKNKQLQDDLGCPKFRVGNCQISLVSIKNQPPQQLCPAVDAVLTFVNQKFTTLISLSSVGAPGSTQYALLSLPVTSGDFIELDLNTTVQQESGDLIDLPADPPALTSLPPKMDSATQLDVSNSVTLLSSGQELLVKGFLVNIIEAASVPAINGALHEGIPLPNLLGIKYENADIRMSE